MGVKSVLFLARRKKWVPFKRVKSFFTLFRRILTINVSFKKYYAYIVLNTILEKNMNNIKYNIDIIKICKI